MFESQRFEIAALSGRPNRAIWMDMYEGCRVGVIDVIWNITDLDMADGVLRGALVYKEA